VIAFGPEVRELVGRADLREAAFRGFRGKPRQEAHHRHTVAHMGGAHAFQLRRVLARFDGGDRIGDGLGGLLCRDDAVMKPARRRITVEANGLHRFRQCGDHIADGIVSRQGHLRPKMGANLAGDFRRIDAQGRAAIGSEHGITEHQR
jgi:hypothetical protein